MRIEYAAGLGVKMISYLERKRKPFFVGTISLLKFIRTLINIVTFLLLRLDADLLVHIKLIIIVLFERVIVQ